MAIKISGTTVIDNSRNLSNLGGLKTVNGTSLFGTGDIAVGGNIVSATPQFSSYGSAAYTTKSTYNNVTSYPGTLSTVLQQTVMNAFVNIPTPPNDGLLKDIDYTYNIVSTNVPVPRPPDQGGPTSYPVKYINVSSRVEYRSVT